MLTLQGEAPALQWEKGEVLVRNVFNAVAKIIGMWVVYAGVCALVGALLHFMCAWRVDSRLTYVQPVIELR